MRETHHQFLPVGRETRREGHAGEIAHDLVLAAVDIHHGHPRIGPAKGHIGNVLRGRGEARRHHQLVAFGQVAQIGAVLIHDGEAFDALVLAALFIDKHHAGIEKAFFAGQARIDGIGDDMGHAPPIIGVGEILLAAELLAGKSVPQAEFGFQPAGGIARHAACHQRLRIDDFPRAEIGRHIGA